MVMVNFLKVISSPLMISSRGFALIYRSKMMLGQRISKWFQLQVQAYRRSCARSSSMAKSIYQKDIWTVSTSSLQGIMQNQRQWRKQRKKISSSSLVTTNRRRSITNVKRNSIRMQTSTEMVYWTLLSSNGSESSRMSGKLQPLEAIKTTQKRIWKSCSSTPNLKVKKVLLSMT